MKLVADVSEGIFTSGKEFGVALVISGYKSKPNKNKNQR